MIGRSSLVLLFALGFGLTGCASNKPAPAPPPASNVTAPPAASDTGVIGTWREFWGIPGETDVTYHDEYEVGRDGGRPFVRPLAEDASDEIQTVTIDGDSL